MTASWSELLAEGGMLALPAAFAGGVIAGFNPCCVPIYPAAAGCCTALRSDTLTRNLLVSAAFVLGGCATTTILGVGSALAGRVFSALGSWPAYVLALLPILFGLHLLNAIRIPLPSPARGSRTAGSLVGAALSGALLGLAIIPCATPVLAGILAYVAATGEPSWGGLLLFVYGLGLGIPVLAVGTSAASLVSRLSREPWRRWAEYAAGAALIGVGLYLIWVA
ncbi:MAG: cytochrome c biogenesis protein CcdA [Acidobacteriota bacterium]|nr:MAG: cytochrome c biogenesis protein CcdA [Acidobacteriota bacterium]